MANILSTQRVTGFDSYDIEIGLGNRHQIAESIPAKVKKILIVHAPPMAVDAERVRQILANDYEVLLAELPDAENSKRIEVVSFCWQLLGQNDFSRSDLVIGLGGGAITDVAGFIAATWLRGIKILQVPTTILAMVDASIGGKTGVNTAEGKNLVGAFHAPTKVIVDLEYLSSLSKNEIRAGFAEIVKCGFIQYPEILDIIETEPENLLDYQNENLHRVVDLSIKTKAEIVGQDFKENGLREFLNYGHTLGHAIEHAERYQWRHGAAISIGLVYAAEVARLTGRLGDAVADRHRLVLQSLGLPVSYPADRWDALLKTMQKDKKSRGGMLRFVVLNDLGKPTTMDAPDTSLLYAAYQELS